MLAVAAASMRCRGSLRNSRRVDRIAYERVRCAKPLLLDHVTTNRRYATAPMVSWQATWTIQSVFATKNQRLFHSHHQLCNPVDTKPFHVKNNATEGRIAVVQSHKHVRLKPGQVKLCTGCGTEVRRADNIKSGSDQDSLVLTGKDALIPGQSKQRAKLSRFVDVVESVSQQRNSKPFLCPRCISLQNNNIYAAYDALRDVHPDVFVAQLSHIIRRRPFGLCVLVVDATDPEHSAMKHVRRVIGKTPCWLVLTKCDLVPRCTTRDVRAWRNRITGLTDTTYLQTLAVSAVTGDGIVDLAELLLSNVNGRDVFFMGAANVGKSSLVQRLANTIAEADIYYKGGSARQRDARRTILSSLNVTCSHLPGTTLQAVRVPCFASNRHALWDTPGILNTKSLSYACFPVHWMEPLSRPQKIALPSVKQGTQRQWYVGTTLLLEASWMTQSTHSETCVLGRIDLVDVKSDNPEVSVWMQAYVHPSISVRIVPTSEAPNHATVPPSYIQHVKELQSGTSASLPDTFTLPLSSFDTSVFPQGRVTSTEKECNWRGFYHFDVVFCTLGWISLSHATPFTVVPYVVDGSVFSKRPAIYPTNLARLLREEQEHASDEAAVYEQYHDEESPDRIHERLRDAARRGRHSSGSYGADERRRGSANADHQEIYAQSFNEDEWY